MKKCVFDYKRRQAAIRKADKESELKYRIIADLEDLKKLNPDSSLIESCLREMQAYNVNRKPN